MKDQLHQLVSPRADLQASKHHQDPQVNLVVTVLLVEILLLAAEEDTGEEDTEAEDIEVEAVETGLVIVAGNPVDPSRLK